MDTETKINVCDVCGVVGWMIGGRCWEHDTDCGIGIGTRARFFHPRTLGVMHYGTVVRISKAGRVLVHFEIDNKRHWTIPDSF